MVSKITVSFPQSAAIFGFLGVGFVIYSVSSGNFGKYLSALWGKQSSGSLPSYTGLTPSPYATNPSNQPVTDLPSAAPNYAPPGTFVSPSTVGQFSANPGNNNGVSGGWLSNLFTNFGVGLPGVGY